MKKLFSLIAVSVALTLIAMPLVYAQGQEKGQAPGAPGAPGAPSAPAQAEKTFEGQLSKVDAKTQTITVEGTGNKEMVFRYTDQTQVLGPERDVQGLAGKTGTPLKISYREAGANNIATRIEVMEKEKR